MKFKYVFLYFIVLAITMISLSCKLNKKVEMQSYFIWVVGDVKIVSNGVEKSAELNGIIKAADVIITGEKSYAAVQVSENSLVKLSENSEISFDAIFNPGEKLLLLKKGEITAKVDKLLKDDTFEIHTPTALAAVRGTTYSVRYDETGDNIIMVAVSDGKVEVTEKDSNKKETANANQTVVVKSKEKKVELRDISEDEKLINNSINLIPASSKKNVNSDQLKDENFKIMNKVQDIREQKSNSGEEKLPQNLFEIKEKYGRVDQIDLYNGKVIKGVILKRGSRFMILIPGKYIYVDRKDVQSTRKIM